MQLCGSFLLSLWHRRYFCHFKIPFSFHTHATVFSSPRWWFVCLLANFCVVEAMRVATSVWLAVWTGDVEGKKDPLYYMVSSGARPVGLGYGERHAVSWLCPRCACAVPVLCPSCVLDLPVLCPCCVQPLFLMCLCCARAMSKLCPQFACAVPVLCPSCFLDVPVLYPCYAQAVSSMGLCCARAVSNLCS